VRLCPHCSSRRAHCRTHGRAASWLRVLPAPPAAPAVAGVPRHRDVPAQPRTAAAVKHLRGRAVPSRALASPNRGADRPVILGGAANSGHSRRTPSASGCGRAASGARTYRFGLNLSAAPPPSRREIVLELRRLNDDSWTTNVVRNTAPATPAQAQLNRAGGWISARQLREVIKPAATGDTAADQVEQPTRATGEIRERPGRELPERRHHQACRLWLSQRKQLPPAHHVAQRRSRGVPRQPWKPNSRPTAKSPTIARCRYQRSPRGTGPVKERQE
jgi:hypothetical protein